MRFAERRVFVLATRVALLTALALVVAWLALHRLSESAPPRWTIGDLPPIPPAEGNAWVALVGSRDAYRIRATMRALTDASEDAPEVERAEALVGALDRHRATLEEIRETYRMERFADACPIDAECAWTGLVGSSAVLSAWAAHQARQGEHAEAFATSEALLRGSVKLGRSVRSSASAGVALEMLALALEAALSAEVAARGAARDDEAARGAALDDETARARRAIVETLVAFEDRGVDLHHAVVGDYLVARARIDGSVQNGLSSAWVLDRRATTLALDRFYAQIDDFVEGRATAMPERTNLTLRWDFRLYNPAGKRLLTYAFLLAADYERLARTNAELRARARDLCDMLEGRR